MTLAQVSASEITQTRIAYISIVVCSQVIVIRNIMDTMLLSQDALRVTKVLIVNNRALVTCPVHLCLTHLSHTLTS